MRSSIYILDNHPIIAEGLKHLLEQENKYQICTGNRPPELYNYLNSQPCDLLIVDYELDNQTALDILNYFKKKINSYTRRGLYHAHRILDHQAADQGGSQRNRDKE